MFGASPFFPPYHRRILPVAATWNTWCLFSATPTVHDALATIPFGVSVCAWLRSDEFPLGRTKAVWLSCQVGARQILPHRPCQSRVSPISGPFTSTLASLSLVLRCASQRPRRFHVFFLFALPFVFVSFVKSVVSNASALQN